MIDKLKQMRASAHATNKDIAIGTGIPKSTVDKIFMGAVKEPTLSKVSAIVHYLGYTLDDLSEKRTEFYTSDETTIIEKYRTLDSYGKHAVKSILEIESDRCASEEPEVKLISLPKSEHKASAGTGFMLDGDYTSWVKVPDTPTARQANIVIEVTGDSMVPMFSDGDNVLVRLTPDIDVGDVGIFSVDGNGYIKKKGRGKLISVNPAYDDIEVGEYSDYRCFGKVLGKVEIIE